MVQFQDPREKGIRYAADKGGAVLGTDALLEESCIEAVRSSPAEAFVYADWLEEVQQDTLRASLVRFGAFVRLDRQEEAVECARQVFGGPLVDFLSERDIPLSRLLVSEDGRDVTLDLHDCNLGVNGARALAGIASFPGCVTSLNLTCNKIGDEGAAAIAGSPTLSHLTSLDLGSNEIGDDGAVAIAGSSTLTSLTKLHVGGNRVGPEGAAALAGSGTLTRLTSLNLGYNNLGDEGAVAIAGSGNLTRLSSLNLNDNYIGSRGAEALAGSTTLSNLTDLTLD